jgi:hypothetical protein
MDIKILRLLENNNKNWKIIPQKYVEKSPQNFGEIRKQIIWGYKI